MQAQDKARPYDLYMCATAVCGVVTFIQTEECPVCHQPGALIRRADTFTSEGQPRDPRNVPAIESGEDG